MSLMDLLPDYYLNSPQVKELQGAFEHWTEAIRVARDNIFRQLNVQTATWGLAFWEKELGLVTDESKPYEDRRSRIMSKLRGQGTTTVVMIKNLAMSFTHGEVDIIEHPGEYRFDIKFTGTYGIPPNLDDLSAAIEEIKPAHLAYTYIFTYITWNEFEAYNRTFDEWEALSLTWDEFEIYREVSKNA